MIDHWMPLIHNHTHLYSSRTQRRGRAMASRAQTLASYDGGTRRRVIVLGCAASMVLTFLLRRYRAKGPRSERGKGQGGAFQSTSERTFRR